MSLGRNDFGNVFNVPWPSEASTPPPTLELANGEDFNVGEIRGFDKAQLGGLLGGALSGAFGAQAQQYQQRQLGRQVSKQMQQAGLLGGAQQQQMKMEMEKMRLQVQRTQIQMGGYSFTELASPGFSPRFKSPVTNRTDNSLVSYIAAPFWALAWVLTFGKFGKPFYNLK